MYEELRITLLLKQSSHHLDIQEHIGHWLHQAQLSDDGFKQTHYDRDYKHLAFSSLYPIEKDGVYRQGRVYILTLRSPLRDTINRMRSCLQQCRENAYFQLISSEQRSKRLAHITEMISITPVIVTIAHKPWLQENSVELLLQQLHANAEKKLRSLDPHAEGQAVQSFIQGIRIENRKPIALRYKDRKLLGNKLRLFIHDDPFSQKLAQIVLGSGVGEKSSSIGAGFCLAK